MENEDLFYQIWSNLPIIHIPEPPPNICSYAKSFNEWAIRLIVDLHNRDIVSVNQAKLMLQDKYFEWQRYVPLAHRVKKGLKGHTCIFQVYEEAYQKLKIIELRITPPMLFIPEKPLPTPPPRIIGISLGEEPEDDNIT